MPFANLTVTSSRVTPSGRGTVRKKLPNSHAQRYVWSWQVSGSCDRVPRIVSSPSPTSIATFSYVNPGRSILAISWLFLTNRSRSGAQAADPQTPWVSNDGQPKLSTFSSISDRVRANGLCFQPCVNVFLLCRIAHLL